MKKLFIYSLFVFLSMSYTLFSFSGNGSGTEADPYQITTVEQLQEMNDDLYAHYILMNDIDASETREWNVGDHDGDPNTPDSAMGFEPIGECFYSTSNDPMYKGAFTGSFDGRGYKVTYLYIDRPNENCIGLFGCIADGGYVYDASIENAEVKGAKFVGVFVGRTYADNKNVTIENCNSGGSVSGKMNVGGFIGEFFSNYEGTLIENCHSNILINNDGGNVIGGFCGSGQGVNFRSCSSSGSVGNEDIEYFEETSVGGFCGQLISDNNTNNISLCQSSCTVYGGSNIGGFCGSLILLNDSDCSIDLCISKGNVYGDTQSISYVTPSNVGGFIGSIYSFAESNSFINIKNCYAEGNSLIRYFCGGFCGRIANSNSNISIENCYSIGRVYIKSVKRGGFSVIDNIKSEKKKIISCYWDTQTSEIDSSDGGTGKTTSEMMMQSTFENWDFDDVWCIVEGKTYPQLQYFVDCDTLVSVPNYQEASTFISVHPNPSDDIITVSTINDDFIINQIEIIDVTGSIVFKESDISQYSINIPVQDLPIGAYYVRAYINNQPNICPFIINR